MKPFAGFVALALLLAPAALAGKGTTPAAYDVDITLEFAATAGEEGIREELELQMLTELRRAACFRSVELSAPGAEPTPAVPAADDRLLLRVMVRELFDETTYDASVAQRTAPYAGQSLEIAHTSRFRALVRAALEHPASRRELRGKQIRSSGAHRPLTVGEDARLTARSQALVELVRAIRGFVCKGGGKRLEKEIGR